MNGPRYTDKNLKVKTAVKKNLCLPLLNLAVSA